MGMFFKFCVFFIACAVTYCNVNGQQLPDMDYNPPAFTPKYAKNAGSVIVIDEAHNNFHTAKGRYTPFAKVLWEDGYQVERGRDLISNKSLKGTKILVIANAVNEVNIRKWELPTPSAFTTEEIDAVREWVKSGGSLFLIADHMPFAGANADLALSFGFAFLNCFAFNPVTVKNGAADIFKKEDGSLVTTGLTGLEDVDSIASFTGQGFSIPAGAISILNLDKRFVLLLPEVAWKFDKETIRMSGKGKSQGAYVKFGKGKVVIFGEAAMFTAQTMNGNKAGMNTPEGSENYKLLLSLIHWLDNK